MLDEGFSLNKKDSSKYCDLTAICNTHIQTSEAGFDAFCIAVIFCHLVIFIIRHYYNHNFPLHPEETQIPDPTGPLSPGFPTDNNHPPQKSCVCVCLSLPIRDFSGGVSQAGLTARLVATTTKSWGGQAKPLGYFRSHFKEMRNWWSEYKPAIGLQFNLDFVLTSFERKSAWSLSVSPVCWSKHSMVINSVTLHCSWQLSKGLHMF